MPGNRLFILSLPRERLRRLSSLTQILPTGMEFELVDALDAKLTRPEVLEVPASAWDLHQGEVACYLSHLGLLQRVCDYDLDHALILEDDFVLSQEGRLTLANFWKHLPSDADHVQLHTDRGRLFKPYRMITPGEHFNRVSPTNVGSWAYVVSRKLAEHVVRHHQVPHKPIDHLYIELSLLPGAFGFYDMNEELVTHRSDIPSTIGRNEPARRAPKTLAEWWKQRWIRH
ncbi:MAG: glycosyltransferase family 25 protein [Verrucomicrobiales bacterium]